MVCYRDKETCSKTNRIVLYPHLHLSHSPSPGQNKGLRTLPYYIRPHPTPTESAGPESWGRPDRCGSRACIYYTRPRRRVGRSTCVRARHTDSGALRRCSTSPHMVTPTNSKVATSSRQEEINSALDSAKRAKMSEAARTTPGRWAASSRWKAADASVPNLCSSQSRSRSSILTAQPRIWRPNSQTSYD